MSYTRVRTAVSSRSTGLCDHSPEVAIVALTAAGIAALHNAGRNGRLVTSRTAGEIDLSESIGFLRDAYETVAAGSRYGFHYFYWYGHYYATQSLYVIGGDAWAWYYPRIRGELLEGQQFDQIVEVHGRGTISET